MEDLHIQQLTLLIVHGSATFRSTNIVNFELGKKCEYTPNWCYDFLCPSTFQRTHQRFIGRTFSPGFYQREYRLRELQVSIHFFYW